MTKQKQGKSEIIENLIGAAKAVVAKERLSWPLLKCALRALETADAEEDFLSVPLIFVGWCSCGRPLLREEGVRGELNVFCSSRTPLIEGRCSAAPTTEPTHFFDVSIGRDFWNPPAADPTPYLQQWGFTKSEAERICGALHFGDEEASVQPRPIDGECTLVEFDRGRVGPVFPSEFMGKLASTVWVLLRLKRFGDPFSMEEATENACRVFVGRRQVHHSGGENYVNAVDVEASRERRRGLEEYLGAHPETTSLLENAVQNK